MEKTKYELGEYVLAKDNEYDRYIIGEITSISSVSKVSLSQKLSSTLYTISYFFRSDNNIDKKELESTEDHIICLVTN